MPVNDSKERCDTIGRLKRANNIPMHVGEWFFWNWDKMDWRMVVFLELVGLA